MSQAQEGTVVAILGGAFDPIHADHMRMAYECLNFAVCDEVWLMPSPDRWDKKLVVDAKHRLAMVQSAVEGNSRIKASNFEIIQGEFRGSYILLKSLQEAYPDHEFRLVVGSDTYPSVPYWRDSTTFKENNYNGHLLLQEFSLILFPRATTPMPDGHAHKEKGYKELFHVATTAVGELSSTLIRERINNCRGLLPDSVYAYIQEKGLYAVPSC
ncbi:MAG: nicotinate (nicotinamide) nucleotide adenylyltransferase [Fibrobacterales bacterium]